VFRKGFSIDSEADYLWREVDDSAIEKLEKRMKVINISLRLKKNYSIFA
jgi:hypothetical protein